MVIQAPSKSAEPIAEAARLCKAIRMGLHFEAVFDGAHLFGTVFDRRD
jgi:hypothetical protein